MVAHVGLFASIPRLVGMALLALFVVGIAPTMWRRSRTRDLAPTS